MGRHARLGHGDLELRVVGVSVDAGTVPELDREQLKTLMVRFLITKPPLLNGDKLPDEYERELLRIASWAHRARGHAWLLDRVLAGELVVSWPQDAPEPRFGEPV